MTKVPKLRASAPPCLGNISPEKHVKCVPLFKKALDKRKKRQKDKERKEKKRTKRKEIERNRKIEKKENQYSVNTFSSFIKFFSFYNPIDCIYKVMYTNLSIILYTYSL